MDSEGGIRNTTEYEIGDKVVISVNGLYKEGCVIPLEWYWTDRNQIRVVLDDGKKMRLKAAEIIQKKQL